MIDDVFSRAYARGTGNRTTRDGRVASVRIRLAWTALVFGTALVVAGCSAPAEPIQSPSTSESTPPPVTGPLPSPSLEITEPLRASTGTPVPTEPAEQPESTSAPEPYPVECLEGTPGPAVWSDGSTRYSQWCFDTRGGQQYLDAESESGAPSNSRGYECGANGCFWPDGSPVIGADRCGRACGEPPTSGDIQGDWVRCIAVKTAEQCRAELDDN